MSRARHAAGGASRYQTEGPEKLDKEDEPKAYDAQGSEMEKEVERGKGETERKRGGRVKRKHGGMVEGMHAKKRLDRPGRKRGGGVGADMHPLTTAARVTDAEGHKTDDGDAEDD